MKILKSLILLMLLLLNSITYAQSQEIQYSGGLAFISGGVGSDESDVMQANAKKWPLMLQFSQIDQKGWGSWLSGVRVRIFNEQKEEIFTNECDGPFLLIALKPGQYVIEALFDGVAQQRKVNIRKDQPEKVSIYWK